MCAFHEQYRLCEKHPLTSGCQTSPQGELHSEVRCSWAPQQSILDVFYLLIAPLMCHKTSFSVYVCLCLQKHFSGELVANSQTSHIKACYTLRSVPFLRWHMYYITMSSSLWAFTKGFSKVLLTGSKVYCTERCSAKWASHLKYNHCSTDSLLLCQEPNILHICQYSFSWIEHLWSSNF